MVSPSRTWYSLSLCCLVLVGSGCDRFKPKTAPQPSAVIPEELARGSTSYAVVAPKVSEDQIVARVNQMPITLQDFKQRTQELQVFGVDWKTIPETDREQLRGQLLEDLVRTELMARDTIARREVSRDPQAQANSWYMLRAFLAREWIQREQNALHITQVEIDAFYKEHKDAYKVPAKVHVRQLVVRSEAEAKQWLKQLLDGANFAELVKEHSIAPNAATGGDLGSVVTALDKERYSRPGQELEGSVLFSAAEGAVFALDVGGVSQIVKGPGLQGSPEAYYLFQVIEKQPSREKGLAEVQDEIKALLTLDRLNKKIGELRNKAEVQLRAERLKSPAAE